MTWDFDALKKMLQENDETAGKAALDKLPRWPRPKPGVSVALMGKGIKRPKGKKAARKDGARGGG